MLVFFCGDGELCIYIPSFKSSDYRIFDFAVKNLCGF
jgi:hypothetical protein